MEFGGISAGWFAIGIAALVAATMLLMLATRLVLGSPASLGNALITVLVSVPASWGMDYGAGYVLLDVVNRSELMLTTTVVIGAVVTVIVYLLMLRSRDGKRPNVIQAAVIYIVTFVLASVVLGICVLIAVYFLHMSLPDPSWFE